jgi:Fe-S oxidoreductase
LLHGHCHQKALFGTKSIHQILTACGADVFEPDSGCCGMAGSFGYEQEHVEISEKMARRVLVPSIENASERTIVASGFSCRHQIAHFTGRKAKHWIEVIR